MGFIMRTRTLQEKYRRAAKYSLKTLNTWIAFGEATREAGDFSAARHKRYDHLYRIHIRALDKAEYLKNQWFEQVEAAVKAATEAAE